MIRFFRLLLALIIIAMKFNEDSTIKMEFFASLGGVDLAELLFIESFLLSAMNYKLLIPPEVFFEYHEFFKFELSNYRDSAIMHPSNDL